MTPERRQLLRHSLLEIADSSKPYAVSIRLFETGVRDRGLRNVEEEIILCELEYLQEKGLIHEEPKVLSPEVRAWKISASGRDYMATGGAL